MVVEILHSEGSQVSRSFTLNLQDNGWVRYDLHIPRPIIIDLLLVVLRMFGAPFQCDHCWFVNINKHEPEVSSLGDTRILQSYIRCVNLDVMWSRESETVKNILGTLRKGKNLSEELGLIPVALEVGPWPIEDNAGMQVAAKERKK